MKKYRTLIFISVVIIISNFAPVYPILHWLIDGVLVEGVGTASLITEDRQFVYTGWIKDTLSDPYYKRYRLMHPNGNPKLYRHEPLHIWKFWRWRDHLTQEHFRQPYMKIGGDEVWKIFRKIETQSIAPYEGSFPPKTRKDSIAARQHFYVPRRPDSTFVGT
jgi:hypothetical protein